eukprot:36150-Rhodomonas_salina.4
MVSSMVSKKIEPDTTISLKAVGTRMTMTPFPFSSMSTSFTSTRSPLTKTIVFDVSCVCGTFVNCKVTSVACPTATKFPPKSPTTSLRSGLVGSK